MNTKLVRLLNGEEIIAEILPSSDAIVTVKNPVRIVIIPNKLDPKQPSVGFAPWAEFSDDKVINLDKAHVLAIMTPIKEFANQYAGMFSGLVLPSSKIIV